MAERRALPFELLSLHETDADPLGAERALIETILREPIAGGTVVVDGPRPMLAVGDETLTIPEADDVPSSWQAALGLLPTIWV